jgi:hypothetical protein
MGAEAGFRAVAGDTPLQGDSPRERAHAASHAALRLHRIACRGSHGGSPCEEYPPASPAIVDCQRDDANGVFVLLVA